MDKIQTDNKKEKEGFPCLLCAHSRQGYLLDMKPEILQ